MMSNGKPFDQESAMDKKASPSIEKLTRLMPQEPHLRDFALFPTKDLDQSYGNSSSVSDYAFRVAAQKEFLTIPSSIAEGNYPRAFFAYKDALALSPKDVNDVIGKRRKIKEIVDDATQKSFTEIVKSNSEKQEQEGKNPHTRKR